MEDQVFNDLKDFIITERSEYKFDLTRETDLHRDLNIWGDDADEFMEKFSRKFNVDTSNLDLNIYFSQEGDRILPAIINFFRGKNEKLHSLTLGDLEEAIINGRLD